METLLINEQFVSQFKYWHEGQIQVGMRFRNKLFKCVSEFSHRQRHQAFDLAEHLVMAGGEVVITASSRQYTIWANLRALSSTSVEQTDHLVPVNLTPAQAPAEVLLMKVVKSA